MESSEKDRKIDDVVAPQDCLSCKVIQSTALLIASAYVFTRGAQAKFRRTKFISAVFATSLGYTGMARFLNLYPFNVDPKSQEVQSSS